jgi:ABC-type multidrug transport system ATPase subunit
MNGTEPALTAWAIEVEALSKSFGHNRALSDINLKVGRGEHVTVFGPNGAGKTTLVKVLSTLSKPSSGTVRVDGEDVRNDPVKIRRRISLVSHETFLYDDLTVYENLRFYGKMYDVPDLDAQVREVISLVRLTPRLYDRVGILSHGMQQRVSIARAIIHNPSILFLDEPEVGLDPQAVVMLRDVLESVNTPERTIVMTTHNLKQGIEMGDRVVILDRGKIVYRASSDDIDTAHFQEIYESYTGTGE